MNNLKEKIKDGEQSNRNSGYYKWAAYILGSIAEMFSFFHRVNTSVLAPYLEDTFKISSASLGLMSSTFFYSYSAFQPVAGILTDRLKPRKMLTISILIMTLGTFTYAYSPNFFFAYMGRLIIGIGSAATFIPASWIITEYFSYNKRGFLFAIIMFIANIGSILATSPLAKLTTYFGWRNALANIAFATLILAVLIWFGLRDDHSNEIKGVKLDNKDRKNIITEEEKSSWLDIFKELVSMPIIKYCIIVSMMSYGALMSFQGLWAIPFFMDIYKMERIAASNLISIIPIGFLIGILILGRFYDTKYGKLSFLLSGVSGLVIYLSFFLFMEKFTSYNFFKILFFIWGFCQASGPYILKIYSMVLPKRYYGTAMGIINIFPFLGCALYQSITGLLFDLFGGADVLHRSAGSYKLYFLFLTLSMIIVILSVTKIIKTLNKNYQGKL